MANDVMTDEIRQYQEIRKRVGKARAIRIFVYHLIAYTLGNIFFGAWNIFTFQNRGDEILWFYFLLIFWSRVPGSGVRGRGSGERETTASSLAGKQQAREKEDNGGQGKDGPAGAIAQGGNGR